MTDFSGRLVSYGLALETTRGTAVAPQYWARWESSDFIDAGRTVLNQSAIDVLNKYSGAEVVEQWSTGQLSGKVTDHTVGLLLFAAFGGYTKAAHAGETTVFDHTFTESQLNASPSLTITRVDPNVTNQFTMCMLNSFELTAKAGDFVRHASNFVGNPSASATATPNFVVEQEFVARHVSVTFNGGSAIPVNSFKLSYHKGVSPYWILGQNNPGNIYATAIEIKGEMVLRYTDDTYKTMRFNNTPQSVVVDIKNTQVTIGNTTNPELKFTMPLCYVNEWKLEQGLESIVTQTVGFEAAYNLGTSSAITAVLTNTHTQYNPAGVS
jgi:hypothetical protein